jgi:hypothetical protein
MKKIVRDGVRGARACVHAVHGEGGADVVKGCAMKMLGRMIWRPQEAEGTEGRKRESAGRRSRCRLGRQKTDVE